MLGERIRADIQYRSGSTSVSTTATEVLRGRRRRVSGLRAPRAGGTPARRHPPRYASGYLYPEGDARIEETHEGQGHAWLEAWIGDWHPFDPTSGDPVAERHVLVARGRDYTDVTPLKGVYHGGSSHGLAVTVELTRVA